MRKIAIGEEVIILASGLKGRIIEYFDDDWIIVKAGSKEVDVKRKEIQPVQTDATEPTGNRKDENEISNPGDQGIGLTFREIKKLSGETNYFEVHLFNRTSEVLLFDYHYYLEQTLQYRIRKEIASNGNESLHAFKAEQLNDQPLFKITCWLKIQKGDKKEEFSNDIKLKAKQFFAKTEAEVFKITGVFSLLFFNSIPSFEEKIDVKEFSHISDEKVLPADTNHIVLIKAAMPDFIDLHAEKLIPGYKKMEASEIFVEQIKHFKRFLELAIQHGLYKIYVVHGIGTGRLRMEIEVILNEYAEVVSFNNNYSPRFGFGATEILLE